MHIPNNTTKASKVKLGDNVTRLSTWLKSGDLTKFDAAMLSSNSLGSGLTIADGVLKTSANLQSLSGLTYASTSFVKMTNAGTFALDTNIYLTSLSGAVLTDQTSGQTIGATGARLAKLWATDITCTNAITGSVTGNAGTVTNANDATTNATMYLMWTATQGGGYAAKTSSNLTYNPSTGILSVAGLSVTADAVGKDFISTRGATITRTAGAISSIAKASGRTLTINRTGGYISSIGDGTRTWTFNRDANHIITDYTVA